MKTEVREGKKIYHITATAMCSSGFETQNFKYRTNNDSRTNVE
jgi:hypothetical protein